MIEPSVSLWSSLLRESSKRTKFPDAISVFLGDSNCGKTKLVDRLCVHSSKESIPSSNEHMSKEIVSYNYFETDESFSETDLPSKVGIWSISDKCFENALQTVIRPSKTDKILFMIGIDLSKNPDDCIVSLENWLRKVIAFSKEYLEANQRTVNEKNNLSQYIQNIKSGKNFTTNNFTSTINNENINKENTNNNNDDAAVSNPNKSTSSLTINTGFPIVVVGCKADVMNDDNNNNNNDNTAIHSIQSAKELQGKLRTICLQFGATLVYTSAIRNETTKLPATTLTPTHDVSNISLLRKYIFHRLYPEVVSMMNLSLEDNVESAFIPAGYDRIELIEISTGYKDTIEGSGGSGIGGVLGSIDWSKPAAATVPSLNNNEVTPTVTSLSLVEMESEEEWLTGLQNFIKQAVDASPAYGMSPATSTASLSTAAAVTVNNTTSSGGIGSIPKSRRNSGNNGNMDPSSPTSATQSITTTLAGVSTLSYKIKRVPPATTTGQQDVSSFFQNLLAKK